MKHSMSRSAVGSRLLLGLTCFVCIGPLLLVLMNAFKSHAAIVLNPLSLPHSLRLTPMSRRIARHSRAKLAATRAAC